MKLQFSLATLLVCMTVLAVVCGIAAQTRVQIFRLVSIVGPVSADPGIEALRAEPPAYRSPTVREIEARLALWGPSSLAATLTALWLIRRLRQPNRPPVG